MASLDFDNALLSAADNHNVANGDESWLERRGNAIAGFSQDVFEGITKGIPAAAISGLHSIANSAIEIGNFMGADVEPFNTYETLKSFDNDLGEYYKEHQAGIDIAGFVGTSFIPGTLGMKAFQAARAGYVGANIGRATGLMPSLVRDYAQLARTEFAAGTSPFTLLEKNTMKALIQGFGSQALDAAAFETAVAVTMFKSPMLDEQSASDLFSNMVVGTVIGGGIGGILHGIGVTSAIKKSRVAVDRELFPYRNFEELGDTAEPSLKILNYFQQKFNLPDAQLLEDVGPLPQGTITKDLDPVTRLRLINENITATQSRLDTLIKQEFQKFANGDALIANRMYDLVKDAKSVDEVVGSMLHTQSISRIGAAESLTVGDVQFFDNLTQEKFTALKASGEWDYLMTTKGKPDASGYSIIGDMSDLKVTGAKMGIASDGYETKDAAFNAGYDIFRNQNGSISVNPASKVLQRSSVRRLENNFIIDTETGGTIVDKATAGIQDFATKDAPLAVRGNQVSSGNLPVVNIDPLTKTFDPVGGNLHEVQSRYIWAQEQKNINWEGKIIHENDLPMLERAYYEQGKGFFVEQENGVRKGGISGARLEGFISEQKKLLADKMGRMPLDEIGMRLNVSDAWLTTELDDIAKIRPGVDYKTPRYIKVNFAKDLNALEQLQKNQIDGMLDYEYRKRMIQERHERNAAVYMGSMFDQFPSSPNWSDPGRVPTSYGGGATLLGFANANYGSAAAFAQASGAATAKLKVLKKTEVAERLNPAISAVITKGQDAVAEAGLLQNKLRESPEAYVFDPRGGNRLIQRRFISHKQDGSFNVDGDAAKVSAIDILDGTVADLYRIHSDLNSTRQVHWKNLKAAAGVMDEYDDAVVYPIPINTEGLKHFVFIKPNEISLADKTRVIAAKDEATLLKLIDQVDKNQFRILTKAESEEHHLALGDYEFAKGINESRVNSELSRKGTLSQFIPTTNKSVLEDMMNWHMKQEEILATSMVEHRYSQAFTELQHLGDRYTNIATSQFRSLTDELKSQAKDPYNDIVKTALDISRASEYKWWRSFNETVRTAIEYPINRMRDAFTTSSKMDDALAQRINGIASTQGYEYGWSKAALEIANTNIAERPWLPRAIAKGQAIMSGSLLQLDWFNAVNNIIGSPIILSAEFKNLTTAIMKGDANAAGKLSQLMKVSVPDGSGVEIPTVTRLIAKSLENYNTDRASGELLRRYQSIGAVTDILQQERSALDNLAWKFTESPSEISNKLNRAYEFGKKWTGNKLAEEMTRFVAADVMRQITDIAVEAGVLAGTKEANEYIQLFVNRTQGNYLHSQRPIVFQGVVGQAISLFQTYQFNLMQQLFRYVGEGDKKSLGILLGLQGSIYGTQGLPAFNFLNTHIVGNASGNTNHKDLYEASNTVFGKALGDWMLYGLGSNALGIVDPSLRVNLYSRGDINPRRLSVLPTNIADIPLVAASTRFVGNMMQAAQRLGNGAAWWPTVSQAIEHNGLSRPLAGLAESVQGYTTTSKGSLLTGGQDLMSIATLMRVGGAKPFDEGVALDQLYRINAYRAKNIADIKELGEAIKTTVVGGKQPTEQQVNDFATSYAKRGGHVESFNRFFTGVMSSANKSQVNTLVDKLNSPFAKQMQVIMGGQPLPDFINQTE